MVLLDIAERVLDSHGWTTRREPAVGQTHFEFDLVAENETAIVFVETVRGGALRRKADALSASIAAVTLQPTAGVKAWEAYLVLIVEDEYASFDVVAQEVQHDLTYCRKIVIDGSGVGRSADPVGAMESELSFLFPLAIATVASAEDVRSRLTQLITEKGFDASLVRSLVDSFDSEADCTCWERVERYVSMEQDE